MPRASLTRFAWLSIGAALITIALKFGSYLITGSVGLLSDALESLINLVAAIIALVALTIAARPPDEDHAYGHDKAEYFSSGIEGTLILFAAVSIGVTAINRLLHPAEIEDVGIGLAISFVASGVNFMVSRILLAASKRYGSITLEADAHHLMTDVWTSVAVVLGVAATAITGWLPLDPLIAIAVALNIVLSGVRLVRRSVMGLLDTALPPDEFAHVQAALEKYSKLGVQFHALRTRQTPSRRFVTVHMLVPGTWTVQQAHDFSENFEAEIRAALAPITVTTHIEPMEDAVSFQDAGLDRTEKPIT